MPPGRQFSMDDLFGMKQGFLADNLSCNDHGPSKKYTSNQTVEFFKKNTVPFNPKKTISVVVSSIGQNSTKETLVSLAAPHFFFAADFYFLSTSGKATSVMWQPSSPHAWRRTTRRRGGRFHGGGDLRGWGFPPFKMGMHPGNVSLQNTKKCCRLEKGRISPGSNVVILGGMFFLNFRGCFSRESLASRFGSLEAPLPLTKTTLIFRWKSSMSFPAAFNQFPSIWMTTPTQVGGCL